MRYDNFSMLPDRAFLRMGGRMTYEGGGKGSSAPAPPDYSSISASNVESSRMAKEAADNDLAFRKQVYAESQPRQAQLEDMANQVSQQQMDIAGTNQQRADEQWQSYKDTYQPNEMQTAADAYGNSYLSDEEKQGLSDVLAGKGGMSPEEAQQALGRYSDSAVNRAGDQAETKAGADVNNAFAQQQRALSRSGINTGRLSAIGATMGNSQAAARLGAGNAARDTVRGQLIGLRTGVANFGRNMPNTAGQAFGLATQAGSQAVANGAAGFQAGLPYAQFAAGGYGAQQGAAALQQQGALGLGGLMSRDYATGVSGANAAAQANGQGLSGLGSMIGTLGAAYMTGGASLAAQAALSRR